MALLSLDSFSFLVVTLLTKVAENGISLGIIRKPQPGLEIGRLARVHFLPERFLREDERKFGMKCSFWQVCKSSSTTEMVERHYMHRTEEHR